jgi:hypothetical protein
MIAVGAIPDRHGGRGSPLAPPRGDTGSLTQLDVDRFVTTAARVLAA